MTGDVPAEFHDLAAMTIALTDGLAVQILAEPGSVDVARVIAIWRRFLDERLAAGSRCPSAHAGAGRGSACPASRSRDRRDRQGCGPDS